MLDQIKFSPQMMYYGQIEFQDKEKNWMDTSVGNITEAKIALQVCTTYMYTYKIWNIRFEFRSSPDKLLRNLS